MTALDEMNDRNDRLPTLGESEEKIGEEEEMGEEKISRVRKLCILALLCLGVFMDGESIRPFLLIPSARCLCILHSAYFG